VDAGQMIKPALARGLQLVGATTSNLLSYCLNIHGSLIEFDDSR
jgi:hypothetical protein